MSNEIAILIAAGMGTRLRPVTATTPKPLVKVNGVSMIETVIKGLQRRGVSDIYVVVGYLGEQFDALLEKYPDLHIVKNPEYVDKNNISSIEKVSHLMKEHDCIVCEADLYVSDPSIFDAQLDESCYYGKMVAGHSDDWVFDQDEDGYITRVGKYGDDQYNMCGICYLKQADAKVVAEAVEEAYKHEGHEQLFWDEIVDQNLDKIKIGVHPVNPEQIVEIDTVSELEQVDPGYTSVLAAM